MNKYFLLYATLTVFICTFQKMAESAAHNFNEADLKSWKKVALVYFHDFPYQHESLQNSPDCFFVPDLSLASGSVTKSVWQCEERISLLRPAALINRWRRKQDTNGAVDFSLPEAGIYHVAAYIESASSIEHNTLPASSGSEVVTGVFLRHSMNVRTYTFQSMLTGQLSKINATPEHRFYVKNRHTWMPLYQITSGMVLTDNHNHAVKLRCSDHRRGHCGVPLHPGEITTIYNLEVYKKHAYFAGKQSLLVHNMYYDDIHPMGTPDSLQTISIRRLAQPLVSKSYRQMLEELSQAKITADFDDAPSVIHREVGKVIKNHNQRIQDYGLAAYEMDYKDMYCIGGMNASTHWYSGSVQLYFKYTDYLYESDDIMPGYPSTFGKDINRKKIRLYWISRGSKGGEENPDMLLWSLSANEPVQNIMRDFEKYSKLVHPHKLSPFDAKKLQVIMKGNSPS